MPLQVYTIRTMGKEYVSNSQLLQAIQTVSADLASLTRTVDRMDQRLVQVEKHTSLIPGMCEALVNQADDLDRHQELLKKIARRTGLAVN